MGTDVNVTETSINGLFVIEPVVFTDERGYMFEAYNYDTFSFHGLDQVFVQDNECFSRKNALRGMHVNIRHPQGKLIRCVNGAIFDVVIDLRKDSSTYMTCFSVILSSRNKKELYIPEGLGHGYCALEDSQILFKLTTHYIPNDELGFFWKSKSLEVDWPVKTPILNSRDSQNPQLEEVWK